MKKYYFKETNTEVKFDSDLFLTLVSSDTRGIIRNSKEIAKVEEEQIKSLMSLGLIEEREEEFISTDVRDYIESFGEGLGYHDRTAFDLFNNLFDVYPIDALCMLWREIMFAFDCEYKDSIEIYDKVYVINKKDGSILEINNTEEHVNDDRFVVFRTKEDAQLAIEITKDYYDEVFRK